MTGGGGGAGAMNPMGMMMGMPGMMPGMPGMPSMGAWPGMPTMPPGMGDDAEKGSKKKGEKQRRFKEKEAEAEESAGGGSSSSEKEEPEPAPREKGERRRRRSRSRRHRTPERIEEVEQFLDDNRINEEAASKVRALSPESQRKVIARPLTGDVQNPSKVMIARVRELQSQNERMKGQDVWAAWGGAMMGATPEAINKFIEEHDLDESASRQLRALPPHHQAVALRWDLSSYRNPSAKFMAMATNLEKDLKRAPMPMMPMMPGMPPMMPGMPGMPPMGMPPMGMPPPGWPMMPGMPGHGDGRK